MNGIIKLGTSMGVRKLELFISQFSHSVISDSLRPHGRQHARLPCPSPIPGACSNSHPSSRSGHPTISSSVIHIIFPTFHWPEFISRLTYKQGGWEISFSCVAVAVQSLSHVRLFVTPWTHSTPGFPVLHYLPEFAEAHIH